MSSGWDTMATIRGFNADGKVVARYSVGRGWTSQRGRNDRLDTGSCYACADLDLGPLRAAAAEAGLPLPKDGQFRSDPEVERPGPIVAVDVGYDLYLHGQPSEVVVRSGVPVGHKYNAQPMIPWNEANHEVRAIWERFGSKMVDRIV